MLINLERHPENLHMLSMPILERIITTLTILTAVTGEKASTIAATNGAGAREAFAEEDVEGEEEGGVLEAA